MITKDQVQHIAKLARIGITEDEIEKFQGELSSILDYVAKLQEVNTEKIEPTSHVAGAENVMREDDISEAEDLRESKIKKEEVARKLVEMAPEEENGWIKTKSIL